MEKGKGLYENLTDDEMAYVLGDEGFFKNAELQTNGSVSETSVTANNETSSQENIISGTLEGVTAANLESGNQLAKEGFINLPQKINKRPTKVTKKPFGLFEDNLETIQTQWDSQYGQWYKEDGTLKDGVSDIAFEDLNKLFKDKKSQIIKLLENRKLPRPDDLPLSVPARPVSIRSAVNSPEAQAIKLQQKNWDLKYGRYYNKDGTLILHPGEANKSLTQKVQETL